MFKLMIVDDSSIIRNRIERSFKASEFEIVATARDGVEALEKFKEFRPDLITMDLTMPGMDGLSCIQAIYELDPTAGILVVSALSDKMTGLLALEYGAQGFIYKPFTDEQLIEALTKIAEQKPTV
ncbi:MAG: response regulator [Neisseria sp.]|nr:response regulator [Neisseria sp.]